MPAPPGEILHLYPTPGHGRPHGEAARGADVEQPAAVGPERSASIRPGEWLAFVAFLVACAALLGGCGPSLEECQARCRPAGVAHFDELAAACMCGSLCGDCAASCAPYEVKACGPSVLCECDPARRAAAALPAELDVIEARLHHGRAVEAHWVGWLRSPAALETLTTGDGDAWFETTVGRWVPVREGRPASSRGGRGGPSSNAEVR